MQKIKTGAYPFHIGQKVICIDNSGQPPARLELNKEYTVTDVKQCSSGCGRWVVYIGIKRKLNDTFFQVCTCGHAERITKELQFRVDRFVDAESFNSKRNTKKSKKGDKLIGIIKPVEKVAKDLTKLRRDGGPLKGAGLSIEQVLTFCADAWKVPKSQIAQKYQHNKKQVKEMQDAFCFACYYFSDDTIGAIAEKLQCRNSTVTNSNTWNLAIKHGHSADFSCFYKLIAKCNDLCPGIFEANYSYTLEYGCAARYDVEKYLTDYQIAKILPKDYNWFNHRRVNNEWVLCYCLNKNITEDVKIQDYNHILHLIEGQELGYRFTTYAAWKDIVLLSEDPEYAKTVHVNRCGSCPDSQRCPFVISEVEYLKRKLQNKKHYCPKQPLRHNDPILQMGKDEIKELSEHNLN